MSSPYRIICSTRGDWFVTAKREGDEIRILAEGDSPQRGFQAILKDLGVEVPGVSRKMSEDGGYEPTLNDWK